MRENNKQKYDNRCREGNLKGKTLVRTRRQREAMDFKEASLLFLAYKKSHTMLSCDPKSASRSVTPSINDNDSTRTRSEEEVAMNVDDDEPGSDVV